MKINNLSEREQLVADLLWTADTRDELELRMKSLPAEDQQRARAITQLFLWGGDEVDNTRDAARVLARFRLTSNPK
jgi:hypothetical protein